MIRFFCCPDTGRKEGNMKQRPCAYISIPWSGNILEALQMAEDACRSAYEAGLTPRCPKREFMRFLDVNIPQELKDLKDMSHNILRRCSILVVCGKTMDEDVMEEIAIAKRRGIATTTLEGILIDKGSRHD